jgi:hypothetical protein
MRVGALLITVGRCILRAGARMRMKFVVRSITAVTDERLLVQLAGESGYIQLNLPTSQQTELRVGQEFVLSDEVPTSQSVSGHRPLGGRQITFED